MTYGIVGIPLFEFHDPASSLPGSALLDDFRFGGDSSLGLYPLPLGSADDSSKFTLYDNHFDPFTGEFVSPATTGNFLLMSPAEMVMGDWAGIGALVTLTPEELSWSNAGDVSIANSTDSILLSAGIGQSGLDAGGQIWAVQASDGRFSFPAGQSLYTEHELSDLVALGSAGDFAFIVNEGNPFYAVNNQGTWEQYIPPLPDEIDVVKTLTLTNISIASTPVTLPIGGTPSPMYLITVDNAEITLDTLGSAPEKTIWFKNTTATYATLIAAAGSTIDGLASWLLAPGYAVELWTDGVSAWWVIGYADAPWSVTIQTPANTVGGVLLRDDWDAGAPGQIPGNLEWALLGLVPTPGSSPEQGAALALHPTGYVSGAWPQLTRASWASIIANNYWAFGDVSEESDAQLEIQMASNAGLSWPTFELIADTGVEVGDAGNADMFIAQTQAADLIWRLKWTGEQDIAGDMIFKSNTIGPVLADQSDGHTYRIISTAGILSTQMVT